jgi:hypothetical protein
MCDIWIEGLLAFNKIGLALSQVARSWKLQRSIEVHMASSLYISRKIDLIMASMSC